MLIHLEGIESPIEFEGAEALAGVLKKVLRGWRLRETTARTSADRPPRIRLTLGARGYERRSPWIEAGKAQVLIDPVDAVCDLLLDIERAYVEDAPKRGEAVLSILHAAAVEMGHGENKGLVVFPSTHAMGKSLLTVALAQAGHRVFADDQLPIIPGTPALGIAPGFLPRLRRPLPEGVDAALAGFVRSHTGPESARFRYVNLDDQRLAPLGTRAPIVGVVLLERSDGAAPVVMPATEAEVLKACVLQSFGRTQNALFVLDSLHAMVRGAKCVKLRYADAPEAVALLEEMVA
ncbi:MAG: hypothetical protein NUV50_11690 [Rhodospirillales bacterium]|nr:hypothetical protein [Rhodospirillales bacterium]